MPLCLRQTDLAVTHATLTQLTVPHLETKGEPNFVKRKKL